MTRPGAPFRFLGWVAVSWTCGRVAFLLADALSGGTAVAISDLAAVRTPPATMATTLAALPPPAAEAPPHLAGRSTLVLVEPAPLAAVPGVEVREQLASLDIIPVPPPAPPRPPTSRPEVELLQPPARASRWSGSAWLFHRPEDAGAGLAAGGQLGGSQAGARLAYRLHESGAGKLAVAARLSTPIRDRQGAEAAVGVDWHPSDKIPFRLSAERRVAIGRGGRNAWSAYAAGGFYRGGLPGGLELDGYGQAGVVGARSRDLFADGAVRIGHAATLSGGKRAVLGAGLWGAAQPGASRVDIGPRAALSLPVAGATVTGAIDWRIRVAGDARPGSGAAFTLAADF